LDPACRRSLCRCLSCPAHVPGGGASSATLQKELAVARAYTWPRGGGAQQGSQLAAAPCRAGPHNGWRLRPTGEQARRRPLSRRSPWPSTSACARDGHDPSRHPPARAPPPGPPPDLDPSVGIRGCACLPAGRARMTRWERSDGSAVWEVWNSG
jgi:hypothetical protein